MRPRSKAKRCVRHGRKVKAIRVYRLAHTQESLGVELIRVGIVGRVVMDRVGCELEYRAGGEVQAVFEGVRFDGNTLASDYIYILETNIELRMPGSQLTKSDGVESVRLLHEAIQFLHSRKPLQRPFSTAFL